MPLQLEHVFGSIQQVDNEAEEPVVECRSLNSDELLEAFIVGYALHVAPQSSPEYRCRRTGGELPGWSDWNAEVLL